MKQFFIILTLIFLLVALPIVEAYQVSYGGVVLGRATHLRQMSPYTGSGVYNTRRGLGNTGFSPFYLHGLSKRSNAHIYLRTSIDNAVMQNPSLLDITYSTNQHRHLRGFKTGNFDTFHAQTGYTGRIHTWLPSKLNN